MKILPATTDSAEIASAVCAGNVVVVPTDTIYGLICDATNELAIARIIAMKQRDATKPMGVFMPDDIGLIEEWVTIPDQHRAYIVSSWPGAITCVLPLKQSLPYQGNTLGVRVPAHEQLLAAVAGVGGPVLQTSVNRSGEAPLIDSESIREYFEHTESKHAPDLLWDYGMLSSSSASKVVDLTNNEPIILRE